MLILARHRVTICHKSAFIRWHAYTITNHMSRPIDTPLNKTENHSLALEASNTGERVNNGSRTRHLFSFVIIAAIIIASCVFYAMLGQTTQSAQLSLDIQTRPAQQVYEDAKATTIPTLRLRALRNFTRAYPDSPQTAEALSLITVLETQEHEAWRYVSEIYYDITVNTQTKRDNLDRFQQEWGEGAYKEEAIIMGRKMQEPQTSRVLPEGDSLPNLLGSEITLPRHESATRAHNSPSPPESLAGAMPQAKNEQHSEANTQGDQNMIPAAVKRNIKPRYPRRALDKGIEASVTLSLDIGADGKVINARVVKAATGQYSADFAKAAIRAAKRTRFTPKQVNEIAMPTNGLTRRYHFQIKD